MGARARTSNDRLRTIWTPEMDRYFINLMLEQVQNGNRIDDCLFSKRAWKHMMASFNAKFKFQYEKDVLKNRHKTLRNLYKAVNSLLNQRGFAWDETRQMLSAESDVWNEYTKEHPDARSYRIRTIPYYEDLCLIYGNRRIEKKVGDCVEVDSNEEIHDTNAESFLDLDGDSGSGATEAIDIAQGDMEALHDIMIDENYQAEASKEDTDLKPQANPGVMMSTLSNRTRTYWQPPMDRYFIDLMLEQVRKGNQIDGVFRKQSWMEMILLFNARFGFNYDMDILRNRYKTLRRQHNVITNLLELNGFSWDDQRQMVIADDYVWQDYIKGHTDARQFMTRPVPYYKDLCVICNDPTVDVGHPVSSQNLGILSDREDQLNDANENHMNKRQFEDPLDLANAKRACTGTKCMDRSQCETTFGMSSLLDDKDSKGESSFSIERVIEAIQALPDVDHDFILDACDLMEDEIKAKTFFALDVKLRKKWLMRKLRPQQRENTV